MVQKGLILRALVASPGDVQREREAIPEIISAWNATHSWNRQTIIEPVKWESHSVPIQGDRPQAIINRQLCDKCDFLIGVFWTRLGTHTGVAASGTAEEIGQFISANKPVLLYFSDQPVIPSSLDQEQFDKLREFKKEMRSKGLQQSYSEISEFRELLTRHLNDAIDRVLQSAGITLDESEGSPETVKSIGSLLGTVSRQFQSEWKSERNSNPYSTDNGKYILSGIRSELIRFCSLPSEVLDQDLRQVIEDLVSQIKALERHQTFLDGGKSFEAFWTAGDKILSNLENLSKSPAK